MHQLTGNVFPNIPETKFWLCIHSQDIRHSRTSPSDVLCRCQMLTMCSSTFCAQIGHCSVESTSHVHGSRQSVLSQNRSWQESKTVFVLNQFPVALVSLGFEHQILRLRWRRRTHFTSFVTWPLRNSTEFGKNAIEFDSNGSDPSLALKESASNDRHVTRLNSMRVSSLLAVEWKSIPGRRFGSRFQFVPRPIWSRTLLPSFAVITETGTSINSHHAGNRNSNETNFRSSLLSLGHVVLPKMKRREQIESVTLSVN